MRLVEIPRYGVLDLNNIPKDFEQKIQTAFLAYTEGTAREFRFVDKLAFIDLCVEYIRRNKGSKDDVKELILEREEFELNEYGELPDRDEYWSLEFMGEVYERGAQSSKLHSRAGICNKYIEERALIRIISAVMAVSDND